MKTTMLTAAALAAALTGTQASATIQPTGWSFAPANQAFSASGTMSFAIKGQPTANCNVSLTGQTRASGYLEFSTATFSDNGDGSCTNVSSPDVSYWYWNPTALKYAHWVHAHIILAKGIRCQGNIGMTLDEPESGSTTVGIHYKIPSPAGACTVDANINLGNISIVRTPGQQPK